MSKTPETKSPGQLAYEASMIRDGQPIQMQDGTDRWLLRSQKVRDEWEYIVEFAQAPLLQRIAELEAEVKKYRDHMAMSIEMREMKGV